MFKFLGFAIAVVLASVALTGCLATAAVGAVAGTAVGVTSMAVKTTGKVAGATVGAAAHAVHHDNSGS